ncbi:MAG: hypothetical protein IKP77_06695 [Acholeplasmatales bacterium]|nr:hypothetical protein [Acholeplasmatales bacterium]
MPFQNIVIDNKCNLSYIERNMLITKDDIVSKVFLDNINSIIVNSLEVTITAYLVNELINRKILLYFCNNKKIPSTIMLGIHQRYDSYNMIKKLINPDIGDIKIIPLTINQFNNIENITNNTNTFNIKNEELLYF